MNKTDIAKKTVSLIVGMGTTKIVSQIIDNNTTAETVTEKVTMKTGAIVVGMMAADATSAYTDRKIDEIVAWWKKNVTA